MVYSACAIPLYGGHRFVSITERYKTDNLEDLQKELEKYHPLK
jgi:integrase/recombinase XerD